MLGPLKRIRCRDGIGGPSSSRSDPCSPRRGGRRRDHSVWPCRASVTGAWSWGRTSSRLAERQRRSTNTRSRARPRPSAPIGAPPAGTRSANAVGVNWIHGARVELKISGGDSATARRRVHGGESSSLTLTRPWQCDNRDRFGSSLPSDARNSQGVGRLRWVSNRRPNIDTNSLNVRPIRNAARSSLAVVDGSRRARADVSRNPWERQQTFWTFGTFFVVLGSGFLGGWGATAAGRPSTLLGAP